MHKQLDVWKDAIELIKKVYAIAELLPKTEEYNLKAQIKRAAVSVALNIAEGKNRQTAKDFAHFLNISIASLAEVQACLEICEALGFVEIDKETYQKCETLSHRINALKNKITKERIL